MYLFCVRSCGFSDQHTFVNFPLEGRTPCQYSIITEDIAHTLPFHQLNCGKCKAPCGKRRPCDFMYVYIVICTVTQLHRSVEHIAESVGKLLHFWIPYLSSPSFDLLLLPPPSITISTFDFSFPNCPFGDLYLYQAIKEENEKQTTHCSLAFEDRMSNEAWRFGDNDDDDLVNRIRGEHRQGIKMILENGLMLEKLLRLCKEGLRERPLCGQTKK